MNKFYEFHPGADLAQDLLGSKSSLIELLIKNPKEGISILEKKYQFGKQTDFWDDFVFTQVVSPVFDRLPSLKLSRAINLYSILDHALFLLYIRRDENPDRFRRAFWNVNAHGITLSRRFSQTYKKKSQHASIHVNNKKKIVFLWKGNFALAHAEFFQEFLIGTRFFADKVEVSLILIDTSAKKIKKNPNLSHIKTYSLTEHVSTFDKLVAFQSLIEDLQPDHLSWVACVQNLTLYMGAQHVNSQSYWSMKYHSIIMDSLDKYAGLGFGGENFIFDDKEWFRGRAFPDLTLPKVSQIEKRKLLISQNIPEDSFVIGCFVREEKLNNRNYWNLLYKLLEQRPNVHFVMASKSLPDFAADYLKHSFFSNSFHHIGWINTKIWCQCLDMYIDSFPRGSCLTILEAIKASVPVFMFDTPHNRESSALPYLASVNTSSDGTPGVLAVDDELKYFYTILSTIDDISKAKELSSQQSSLLKSLQGRNILYAKDYLNYFLDLKMTITRNS